jgi:signal transduction histidine kinase
VSGIASTRVGTADAAQPAMRRRGGLGSMPIAAQMIIASVVLAALVGLVLLSLLLAISSLRSATNREVRAKDVVTAAVNLEKLALDVQTGVRGFVLTGRENTLTPYVNARRELPPGLAELERLSAGDTQQAERARRLRNEIDSYIQEYSVPLIEIARENREAATQGIANTEDRRRIGLIRRLFDEYITAETTRADASARAASERADLAIGLALLGILLCAALIFGFGIVLARSIARPIRGVAEGASRLAGGEYSVRLREGGPGEVGELTRSFNAMAEKLERGRRELEQQNRKLRESERIKSELVGIVSHEVRTPLASVLGFTSLLLSRDPDPETRKRYLEIVDVQGRRLSALLDDFLDVQRLEEGRLELRAELVDMAALLEEQVQLFEAQSELHRLTLSVEQEPLGVRGDPNRLAQVVGNLLSNAIKYSPEGGTVEVVGEQANGSVRVSVRDHGVGIPAEQQDRIFTKFYRGDASTSGIAGSGLGLAFARAVIEAHGGRMGFTSTRGGGSTFFLELPTAAR